MEDVDSIRYEEGQQTVYKKFIADLQDGGKIIGRGKDKIVYEHPTDESKVVAVFKSQGWPLEMIKSRFYLNKILSLLLPDNIPNIHLAASEPFSLILDKVSGVLLNKHKVFKHFKANRLIQKMRDLGVDIDAYDANFIIDKDSGDIKYIDTFSIPISDPRYSYSRDKLHSAITRELRGDQLSSANGYLNRLDNLQKAIQT